MAPRLGVPPDRVRVIHYGWRQQDAGTSAASLLVALPERYVLTVGDLLDHKNIETLMDAFDRLVSDTSYRDTSSSSGGRRRMRPTMRDACGSAWGN